MGSIKAEIVVPDWVTYIGVDKNGKCYGFEKEPIMKVDVWMPKSGSRFNCLYDGVPPKNWHNELYTWGYK